MTSSPPPKAEQAEHSARLGMTRPSPPKLKEKTSQHSRNNKEAHHNKSLSKLPARFLRLEPGALDSPRLRHKPRLSVRSSFLKACQIIVGFVAEPQAARTDVPLQTLGSFKRSLFRLRGTRRKPKYAVLLLCMEKSRLLPGILRKCTESPRAGCGHSTTQVRLALRAQPTDAVNGSVPESVRRSRASIFM